MEKKNPKVLVTGAAGFIGSHLVRELLVHWGPDIIAIDDLSGGFRENLPAEVKFIEGSITDPSFISNLFKKYQFKYVYHLAAYAAEGLSHFIRRFNYTNNLIGSVNLINESVLHKVGCFVFTSSIAVYGSNQVPMREDMVPQPEDPYGIAKYAVELDLKAAHEMFGLNFIIFRPHNVYGELQNIGDRYRNVIGIFMNQVMKNQPMTIFGDGTQTRAFSHVDDVAPVIANAVDMPECYNEIFNIGADQPYSINTLAEVVADCMGVKPEVQYIDARNEVKHAYSDHSKSKEYFSCYFKNIGLKEGVQRMADWARVHGARTSSKYQGIEIEKNMPSIWARTFYQAG